MSKAIERRMTLKDQVTPTMSKINKSTLSYKKNMRNLKDEGQKTWRGLKSGMLGVVATATALIGSAMAISKMEEAYKAQSEAEVKLQTVFKATNKATNDQVDSLKKYASEMQKVGVVGDEVTLAGMQQLATFNVTSSTVEQLTEGMLDLGAQQKGLNATQGDMVNIGNMVGKVMNGQVGALSRVGISFNEAQEKVLKYGTESQKAATLAEVLRQNVGGVNKALAETDIGRIQQAKNTIGDLQEVIGGAVVSIKGKFAKAFMEDLPAIEAKVNAVASALNNWVDGGGVDRFIGTLKLTYDTTKQLTPIIMSLGLALVYYKTAALAAKLQTQGLNATMAANPVGAVIVGMVALITVITLVRKHKDLLKLKWMETWNAVAGFTEGAINGLIGGANTVISAFDYMGQSIKHSFSSMWDEVVLGAESAVGKLAKPLNAVLGALGKDTISVDFSSKLSASKKPVWEKQNYIQEIQVKRYSDDTVMSQIEQAKREKQINKSKELKESNDALLKALDSNTDAIGENTGALKKGSSSDLTGEEIADRLLPRLERVIYG